MASSQFTPMRYVVGDTADLALNLRGHTGKDGPQCVLEWDAIAEDIDGFRIVKRKYHYPSDVDDGNLVFSTVGRPEVLVYADTLVIHEELYHYAAFLHHDGEWYSPDSSQVAIFSGTRLEFESAYDTAASGSSPQPTVFTLPANSCFTRGARTLSLSTKGGTLDPLAVGDWVRLGTEDRGLIAKITSISSGQGSVTLDYKLDEWVLPERSFTEIRDISLVFTKTNGSYANKSTVARATGSFLDAGIVVGMPLVFSGTQAQTLDVKYPTGVFAGVLKFATNTVLADEGPVSSPVIRMPAAYIIGDTLTRLRPQGSFLSRRIYEDFLPSNFQAEDVNTNQYAILAETTLDDGEKACLGSPGLRYGLERFIASLAAEFAKAHAAGNYLPTYRDLTRAPLHYVRYFGERYGLALPNDMPDTFLARAIILAQPGVVRHRGTEELLRVWCRIVTGQNPRFIYGKNRVLRLGTLSDGLPWEGIELSAGHAGPVCAMGVTGGYIPSFPSGYLVGMGVSLNSPTATVYTVTTSNTAFFEASVGGNDFGATATPTAGDFYYFHSILPALSGPDAPVKSLYDNAIVDGVGGFFNDRGMALYLPDAMTDEEKDMFSWICEDLTPETSSLLVYAALTLAIDMS